MIAPGADNYSPHRFTWFDVSDQVWNGTGWEAWDDADAADYMDTATRQGSTINYVGTPPPGAVYFELWVWTGALETSAVVYEDEVPVVTAEDGDPLPATRKLLVRLRKANGDPFDPVSNIVELIDPSATFGVRRQSTGAIIVGPVNTATGLPYRYTRTGVGDYEYEIAENGLFVEYGWRYQHPVTLAVESHLGTSAAQPAGTYANTEDVYEELGEENALIHGNLSNDGTNSDSPQYIRDALRYADVRVNVKLGAYSPPPAAFPVTSTESWVTAAINEAASKYAAGALLNKRAKQSPPTGTGQTAGDALVADGDALLQMLMDGGLIGVTLSTTDTTTPGGTWTEVGITWGQEAVCDEFSSN